MLYNIVFIIWKMLLRSRDKCKIATFLESAQQDQTNDTNKPFIFKILLVFLRISKQLAKRNYFKIFFPH